MRVKKIIAIPQDLSKAKALTAEFQDIRKNNPDYFDQLGIEVVCTIFHIRNPNPNFDFSEFEKEGLTVVAWSVAVLLNASMTSLLYSYRCL